MATIGSSNGRFALVLSEKEFNELGFEPNHEFEVVKAKPGLWVVVDKGVKPVDALDRETAELEKKIHQLTGKKFNIASPLQLKEILFAKLKIARVSTFFSFLT